MSTHKPMLPSLAVSALLVPLPFSSWVVRHAEIDAHTPSTLPNLPLTEDHRPYLSPPSSDVIEPIPFPAEDDGTFAEEFSFRAAWELTRSLESLPPAWRSAYRRWNRTVLQPRPSSSPATRPMSGAPCVRACTAGSVSSAAPAPIALPATPTRRGHRTHRSTAASCGRSLPDPSTALRNSVASHRDNAFP
jgi:hypothetical protein